MTNLQEKIYTNDDIIKKVSLYINREIDKSEIVMKSFLKVLLAECLQMEINKLNNGERQELYRETARLIVQYRISTGNERTWSAFSCHLINSLKNHKLGVKLFCEIAPNVAEIPVKQEENEALRSNMSKNEATKENSTSLVTEIEVKQENLAPEVLPRASNAVLETQMVQIPPTIVQEVEKLIVKQEKMDVEEPQVDSTNRELPEMPQTQSEMKEKSISEDKSSRTSRISSIESNLSTNSSRKTQKDEKTNKENQLLGSNTDEIPQKSAENDKKCVIKDQKLRNSRNFSIETDLSTTSGKKSRNLSTGSNEIPLKTTENDENPSATKLELRKSRNLSMESTSSTNSSRRTRSRTSISEQRDDVETKTPQRRSRKSTNNVTEPNILTSITLEHSIFDYNPETEKKRRTRKPSNGTKKSPKVKKQMKCNVESLLLHNNPKLKLALNCTMDKICEYSFTVHSKSLEIEMHPNPPNKGTQRIPITDVDISKLLYWPGVGIRLSLPEIEIFRFCISNASQNCIPPFLEIGEDAIQHTTENDMGCFKSFKKEGADLSTFGVEYYLQLIIAASKASNFSKQQELETVINTFLDDLRRLPFYRLKTEFSFCCASHKYYRDFEGQIENDERESLNIREIFNPEVVICIKRCNFEQNTQIDMTDVNQYFEKIIHEKNPEEIEKFNNILNQGFALEDLDCVNKQFTGPLKVTLLCDHLGRIADKEFYCVKCMFFAKIGDLAGRKWVHECH